jgi:tryptophan synthase alpha chain
MNRIEERFARLKQNGQKGFIVYIGAGDPNLEMTRRLALAFDKIGVDVLELGVPFSDPLADGLVNQLAAQRGLESGTTPAKVLQTVAAIRKRIANSHCPVYLFQPHAPAWPGSKFVRDAAAAGVDGLLALDLPPEESGITRRSWPGRGFALIYLVAPTTPESRIELIVRRGTGFIYYVSREGVTGMQKSVSETIGEMTAKIRAHTDCRLRSDLAYPRPNRPGLWRPAPTPWWWAARLSIKSPSTAGAGHGGAGPVSPPLAAAVKGINH